MDLVIKFDHGAVAVASSGERPNSATTRRAVLGLVAVLGVLAFIFSAVSPNDDENQQEFAQSRTRRCVVRNWKSISSVRVKLVNPVHDAIVPRSLSSIRRSAIERVLIDDLKSAGTAFPARTSGRSPPTRSFEAL